METKLKRYHNRLFPQVLYNVDKINSRPKRRTLERVAMTSNSIK
ncbi:hypothetical protein [Peribacillus sp. ACCC06369]|nr:hypothetical protein [Peribacillus sp. ACCC06369]MDM5359685.1 hypothetical protein [Peribacillus sp. ACCC06369]